MWKTRQIKRIFEKSEYILEHNYFQNNNIKKMLYSFECILELLTNEKHRKNEVYKPNKICKLTSKIQERNKDECIYNEDIHIPITSIISYYNDLIDNHRDLLKKFNIAEDTSFYDESTIQDSFLKSEYNIYGDGYYILNFLGKFCGVFHWILKEKDCYNERFIYASDEIIFEYIKDLEAEVKDKKNINKIKKDINKMRKKTNKIEKKIKKIEKSKIRQYILGLQLEYNKSIYELYCNFAINLLTVFGAFSVINNIFIFVIKNIEGVLK